MGRVSSTKSVIKFSVSDMTQKLLPTKIFVHQTMSESDQCVGLILIGQWEIVSVVTFKLPFQLRNVQHEKGDTFLCPVKLHNVSTDLQLIQQPVFPKNPGKPVLEWHIVLDFATAR